WSHSHDLTVDGAAGDDKVSILDGDVQVNSLHCSFHDSLASRTINTAAGDDEVDLGELGGAYTTVNAGSDNDTVWIGSGFFGSRLSDVLAGFDPANGAGPVLVVHGGSGVNSLNLNDSDEPRATEYGVGPDYVSTTLSYPFTIAYDSMSQVNLSGSTGA